VVGQATEAVRHVAESASELAQDTYQRGAGYVRDGLDRYPEAGRSIREGTQAVSRPVEQHPLTAILVAGAVGYLLAYLIHGSGFRGGREDVPDYGRTRDYNRHSRWGLAGNPAGSCRGVGEIYSAFFTGAVPRWL
jgi:ElaB/YqjD/DUF883 family membrane-anchored ribosome-binding protein